MAINNRLIAALCALGLCAWLPLVQAGFVFTPHLSEYSRLPRGPYFEANYVYTEIDEIFNEKGDTVPVGDTAIPSGESIDANLLLFKALWIGNMFRDSNIPILNDHDQIFRIIQPIGQQEGTGRVVDLADDFGQDANASGLGDTFVLAGIYGDTHRWGPMRWNGLFATTVKLPTGDYEQDSLLNIGTNYLTVAPQLAFHHNLFGRLFIDWTVSYQFNDDNDEPAFGGLTPTEPADLYTAEANFAWKFSERFFIDAGISYRSTSGEPNRFENPTINLVDQPIGADPPLLSPVDGLVDDLLGGLLPGDIPDLPNPAVFFIEPQPGNYEDEGIRGTLATFSMYYIYRASTVLQFRVAYPVSGKGSFFTLPYDVFAGLPTGPGGSFEPAGTPISTVDTRVNGVQEAAAVSASPFFELRLVYLPWAP